MTAQEINALMAEVADAENAAQDGEESPFVTPIFEDPLTHDPVMDEVGDALIWLRRDHIALHLAS